MSHLKVKRLRPGDTIFAFDGCGRDYQGELRSIGRSEAVCGIVKMKIHRPPERKIVLGLGILQSGRMAAACEKAAETGVWEIAPIITERSERRLNAEGVRRLNRMTLSAVKQSGRMFWTRVTKPRKLTDLLGEGGSNRRMLYADVDGITIGSLDIVEDEILFCVGPEGGFSDGELSLFREAESTPVSLGLFRLRSETAAILGSGILAMKIR